ncbi:hypothetical protein [Actinokineospora sp. NBRC 105648]|uniref:hypothetical protein n=1 Tax=Actinokineospora sp. NBRC 105648 TaxID=3032206 RepID=UPI0024A40596|nr:hypothetical protein [Actinokineospora sp. NBRC 105648]GLZ40016.1 hypothetical protein Acsp05_36400 [Actinokineospora sp. NBRC 105648]
MVDHVRSPVLIELCLLLRDFLADTDQVDHLADVDLYRHVTFAASLRHSGREFTARPAPEIEDMAAAVLRRVSTGPLGDAALRSPQSRFADDAAPRAISLVDGTAADDKPGGALWTSSFLPDGTSTWQWGEWAEFGHDRQLFTVTFDPAAVRVFTIGSPADYERLVNHYPRSVNGSTRVHWAQAAEDIDAVHLTVSGLLTAQYVPVVAPCGAAVLTGWDAESTAWLHLPPGLGMVPVGL